MKDSRKGRWLFCTLILVAAVARAQDSAVVPPSGDEWDLRRCVDYAVQHNISIRQADVQRRVADLLFDQSKKSRIPNASFGFNNGLQFGRSIDPTTNLFTNQQLLYQGFNFSTDVTIFNWNRINNNILSSRLESRGLGGGCREEQE